MKLFIQVNRNRRICTWNCSNWCLDRFHYLHRRTNRCWRLVWIVQANIYLFKVNDRNTRTRCEMCSKLTLKTPKRRHWRHSDVFIVTPFFFVNNPFLTLAPKIVEAFLKNRFKNLFSNCLIEGPLTSIV